jgi:5-deoxy-glucuronate isomerase
MLHVHGARQDAGQVLEITPESAGWDYVGLAVHRSSGGEVTSIGSDNRELCCVVVHGACQVAVDGLPEQRLGGRTSPFAGSPAAIYLPPRCSATIRAVSDSAELAVASAPATADGKPRLIQPGGSPVEIRGEGVLQRAVRPILMEDQEAESLLVVEVVVPAGHWAGFPPHKHDESRPPDEAYLEEIYYYRIERPQGFAVQRIYTADHEVDETLIARDRDAVLVPRGYHPMCAAPGYDVYFLNAMAGPARTWRFTIDPEHAWIPGGGLPVVPSSADSL